jgi:hypothetical protein
MYRAEPLAWALLYRAEQLGSHGRLLLPVGGTMILALAGSLWAAPETRGWLCDSVRGRRIVGPGSKNAELRILSGF